MTREELHIKALSKAEDSAEISTSMTVVKLGFVTTMLYEMQCDYEAQLQAKDEQIQKMRNCENCVEYVNIGSNCLLDMEDSLTCKANNLLKWRLRQ